MNDASSWFDVLIVMCGIYIIYTMVRMKREGKINPSVLLGKNITESMIKDKEGFIKYMYPKAMGLGIITVVCGIADYLNEIMGNFRIVSFLIMIAFFVVLAIYCVYANKAKKKFIV